MKGLGLVALSAALVLSGLGACSSGNAAGSTARRASNSAASHEPRGEPMPHQECVTGGTIVSMDVNNDGHPDIRTMMVDGHPACRETDANFDGRVDIYRWFDPAGNVTRVEDDFDFDGRIDSVATYANGEIQSDVLDTNFDGRTDTWRDYRHGHVIELRRDSDGDGLVDLWERFDEQGHVTYTAIDANHDGRPDEVVADGGVPGTPDPTPDPTTVTLVRAGTSAAPGTPATPATTATPAPFPDPTGAGSATPAPASGTTTTPQRAQKAREVRR